MKIEINLGEEWADEETLGRALLESAAAKLLKSLDHEIRGDLGRHARAVADEEIRKLLGPALADAVEKAIQPTDSFGGAKGQKVTLREYIVEAAKKDLKAAERRAGRSEYGSRSLVEEIIAGEVRSTLRTELKEAVDAARKEVVAAVREQASEVISETITRLARAT